MCGIIAYNGTKQALPILIKGLKTLEYRGYDSAGVALHGESITITRSVGTISALTKKVLDLPKISATTGIGHTRWATHGQATLSNTHPHTSGHVTLVHNGVITNFRDIKMRLTQKGITFACETDTEVIAALINHYYQSSPTPLRAIQKALRELQGSWALAIMFNDQPRHIYAAAFHSPLVIGQTTHGILIASDQLAIDAPAQLYEIKDGSIVDVHQSGFETYDMALKPTKPTPIDPVSHLEPTSLGAHPDFMHKEIYDQPAIVKKLLDCYTAPVSTKTPLVLYGCGSAFHAGLAAQYSLQPQGYSVQSVLASDSMAQYTSKKALHVAISQSGETADTLSCFDQLNKRSIHSCALVNSPGSRLAKVARHTYQVMAGQEISVASTKAFTAQLITLHLLFSEAHDELSGLPSLLRNTLRREDAVIKLLQRLDLPPYWLVLGKDELYPIALETALKIREITYLPCFGVPTSEMKHGTHALLGDESMVVFLLPRGDSYDKQRASLDEICARSLNVIVITDEPDYQPVDQTHTVRIPYQNAACQQFSFAVIGQLLAYHLAHKLGRNIDKPRNLAKSVTVE